MPDHVDSLAYYAFLHGSVNYQEHLTGEVPDLAMQVYVPLNQGWSSSIIDGFEFSFRDSNEQQSLSKRVQGQM